MYGPRIYGFYDSQTGAVGIICRLGLELLYPPRLREQVHHPVTQADSQDAHPAMSRCRVSPITAGGCHVGQ